MIGQGGDSRKVYVRQISKNIGSSSLLSNISLEVGPGECFGILGENGSGKTTLLRVMTGLVLPSSGEVSIMGYNPHEDPVGALSHISALIGIPALYPNMSAYENLDIFSDLPDKKRAIDALANVGLVDERHKKVGAYSRGMLQRLGIALALLHERPFIMLDEPTQGVDDVWIGKLGVLFREKLKNGQALIITSHDFDFVMDLCSQVMILDSGENVYAGNLKEVAEFPYFFQLVCDPRDKAERVMKKVGYVHRCVSTPKHFELTIEKEKVSDLVDALVSAGCNVHEFAMKHYTLSDLARQRNNYEEIRNDI